MLVEAVPAPAPLYTGKYALVIGVGDYTSGWDPLSTVQSELDQVEATLTELGFEVRRIRNPDSRELSAALEGFVDDYGYDAPDHQLLIFYSGHGHSENLGRRGKRGYIVPADAPLPAVERRKFKRMAVSMESVMKLAAEIESKHVLFVFDSCFAGTLFKVKGDQEPRHITAKTLLPVRQFITAGRDDETVPAKSVFTPLFVRGLEGAADYNEDGFVTGTELGSYLHDEVVDYEVGQTPQRGTIRDPDLDEGDFVFRLPPKPEVPVLAPAYDSPKAAMPTSPELPMASPGMADVAGEAEEAAQLVDACDGGAPLACSEVGLRYEGGVGLAQSYARAAESYRRACDGGSGLGCTKLGVLHEEGQGVLQDRSKATEFYGRGCEGGDAEGCSRIGIDLAELHSRNLSKAAAMLKRGCDGGDPLGCTHLGMLHEQGRGVPEDDVKAAELFQSACEAGSSPACSHLAALYEAGEGVAQSDSKALDLFRQACDRGDPLACLNLGNRYEQGRGVEPSEAAAKELYRRVCDGGYDDGCAKLAAMQEAARQREECAEGKPDACTSLGLRYREGDGVTWSHERSVDFLRQACDGGDARGCRELANAERISRDLDRHRQGCEAGAPESCTDLALMYRNGTGVRKSYERAAELYRRGCNGGDGRGCTWLGIHYHKGEGVPESRSQAASLFQQGCTKGHATGCANLGGAYRNGDGVRKDPARALQLFRRGCNGGSPHGCYWLGKMYEKGEGGVGKSPSEARRWFRKACDGGSRPACSALKSRRR